MQQGRDAAVSRVRWRPVLRRVLAGRAWSGRRAGTPHQEVCLGEEARDGGVTMRSGERALRDRSRRVNCRRRHWSVPAGISAGRQPCRVSRWSSPTQAERSRPSRTPLLFQVVCRVRDRVRVGSKRVRVRRWLSAPRSTSRCSARCMPRSRFTQLRLPLHAEVRVPAPRNRALQPRVTSWRYASPASDPRTHER